MGYGEERKRILGYVSDGEGFIALLPDKSNVKKYYAELEVFSDNTRLAIRYPGYKTTETNCDYCVCLVDCLGEHPISHEEIMRDLYNKTTAENYEAMKCYVERIAVYGKNYFMPRALKHDCTGRFSYEKLALLMFYIAIQEDINYPEPRQLGRKMCFYRYLEAIYCKVHDNHTLEEALRKASVRKIRVSNWEDAGNLYDVVRQIRR